MRVVHAGVHNGHGGAVGIGLGLGGGNDIPGAGGHDLAQVPLLRGGVTAKQRVVGRGIGTAREEVRLGELHYALELVQGEHGALDAAFAFTGHFDGVEATGGDGLAHAATARQGAL